MGWVSDPLSPVTLLWFFRVSVPLFTEWGRHLPYLMGLLGWSKSRV